MVALFMSGVAVAGVVGGPLSGWIMKTFAGLYGLSGWQWLFLLEGLPSVRIGSWTLFYLDDGIRSARWLSEDDKQQLERAIVEDGQHQQRLPLALVYFLFVMGLYGVSFWLPQLIKNSGVKDVFDIGLLTAIPYAASGAGTRRPPPWPARWAWWWPPSTATTPSSPWLR